MRDGALWAIPYPIRIVVGLLAYRGNMQTMHGQGTGRFSVDELAVLRREVWDHVNSLVVDARNVALQRRAGDGDDDDDEPFWVFKGAEPTEADSTLFGFITGSLMCTAYVKEPGFFFFRVPCRMGMC